jgi:predicted small secreted protein
MPWAARNATLEFQESSVKAAMMSPSFVSRLLVVASLAGGLVGCNTVHGAGEDLSIAGKATGQAVDNAGHAISNTASNVQQGM